MTPQAKRVSYGVGFLALVTVALLGACDNTPIKAVPEKLEVVKQGDALGSLQAKLYESMVSDACNGGTLASEAAFVGRVAPDAPDYYRLSVGAGDKVSVRVKGLYGFDPWVALMCKPTDGSHGWWEIDSDDAEDRASSLRQTNGPGCGVPNPQSPSWESGFDTVPGLDPFVKISYFTQPHDCVVLISSNEAWADFHFNEKNFCQHPNLNDAPETLPGKFALSGAPDLFRSSYVATVTRNATVLSPPTRGCTDSRSFKLGQPVVDLVDIKGVAQAADVNACRDACVGAPPAKCLQCPVGQQFCSADKKCYSQTPLVCPSPTDQIYGGCNCCGAVDDVNMICFPGACHAEITWFEYKCPCAKKGTSCTTNDQCCGEKCNVPGGQTTGACRCLNPGEQCHVARDCCSYQANETTPSCVTQLVNGAYYGQCK